MYSSIIFTQRRVTANLQPFIQRLEDRYPVNNYRESYPNQRVYKSDLGECWELTDHRLQAWAFAWVRFNDSDIM